MTPAFEHFLSVWKVWTPPLPKGGDGEVDDAQHERDEKQAAHDMFHLVAATKQDKMISSHQASLTD